MPPLKDRGKDIMILANHFANQTAKRYGLKPPVFTSDAEQALMNYPWPGNVREMKHLLERVVLLAGGGELTSDMLALVPGSVKTESDSAASLTDMTLDSAEMLLIKQALDRTNGNVSRAARELGTTRMALRYRMKKYNL